MNDQKLVNREEITKEIAEYYNNNNNVKKTIQLVKKCLNCGNVNIVSFRKKLDDKDRDGMHCDVCNCFHYLDEDGLITYEYHYSDVLNNDENVNWKISNN